MIKTEARTAAGSWRVGLIGDPVAHSLSPALQQPGLDALGIPARYALWPTPATELPHRVAGLREPDVLGANVTLPHKLAVMALLDEVSPLAERAGAVNAIINRQGRLLGDNTDIAGFAAAVREVCSDPAARHALILGAGGAARAVALALDELRVASIALLNRNADRASRLATELSPVSIGAGVLDAATLRRLLPHTTMLINATALGWRAGETPLPFDLLALLPEDALVVDLTYRETDLLIAARDRRLATLDGLPMLIHQGARALTLWTGQAAPLAVMATAAAAARAARERAG
ncbi:MAG: shikimate dehydrogenase [Chloroflexota bacterium]|nr:shikimate dehydrogenase [Chloroflexota bacterium]